MSRDVRAYLWDAAQALEKALQFAAGRSREDYLADELLRAAVDRKLQNAGEALAQLRKVDPIAAARVPEHERVIAFRHVLVHRYEAIDDNRIFNLLEAELPAALTALRQVLDDLEEGTPDGRAE